MNSRKYSHPHIRNNEVLRPPELEILEKLEASEEAHAELTIQNSFRLLSRLRGKQGGSLPWGRLIFDATI